MYLSLIVTFLYIFFFVLYRNRMKMNFSDDEIVAIMIEKRKEFFEKN